MNSQKKVPYNKPYVNEYSKSNLQNVLLGNHFAGGGPFTRMAENFISERMNLGKVVLTSSCTDALEMISLMLDLGVGDEVIMPSFNFTSSALTIVGVGATPVFVDVDENTGSLDPKLLLDAITSKTKAVVSTNYGGFGGNLRDLRNVCNEFNLMLIEDNAHGFGSLSYGVPLGTFGDFSVISFHETKNIHCGEGGALIINNRQFYEKSDFVRDKGTNRQSFLDGVVDKYSWVSKGSSFLPPESSAAFLMGQFEEFNVINKKRRKIYENYRSELGPLAESGKIMIPDFPQEEEHTGHIFYLKCGSKDIRNEALQEADQKSIQLTSHYQPLHNSKAGKQYAVTSGSCLESTKFSERIIRLPIFYEFSEIQQEIVIEFVKDFFD